MSRQVYFEHDNRRPTSSAYRPPAAMGRQRKFRDYPRGYPNGKSRHVDTDGDVDMGIPVDRRYNPYGQRNNNRKKHKNKVGNKSRHHGGGGGQYDKEAFSWYRFNIPFGRKMGKEFILNTLRASCKNPLIPINFQFVGNGAVFYIQDHANARQIRELNRRITTPDGFKMAIQSTRCPAPITTVDSESSELIKKCMSARYDAISHCLNLSKFHHDESLKAVGLYVPLDKKSIMGAVVNIIKEHIPMLETLNISENRLTDLELLNELVPVCKQLKLLILSHNKLAHVNELTHLKGLNIVEIVLDGNPLCDVFKDRSSYISAVRDRFPKLLKLDGHELPAPIGFDLGHETCPVSKKSFFAADDVKDLVIQFLDQYYTIYDSGDRSKLLDAYHDQANFSLCLCMSRHSHKTNGSVLAAYNLDNRNLLKTMDYSLRYKLLKQGKLSIVSALSELPQTMHDPTSFSVDIFHVSPGLMSFSVTGVFKEVGADINNATLTTFSRTYVVVAQGSGFAITNETLFIAHASQDQQTKAFKVPAPTPSPSPAPSTEEKSPAEKQLMVIELSKQTGMNLDFSAKCLEENDWDYQRSVGVFLKFQSEGKLPPEAFIAV